jgi:hypothetical protein
MSYDNLSCVSSNLLKFYQLFTGEERRIPFILDDYISCLGGVFAKKTSLETNFASPFGLGNFSSLDWYFSQIPLPNMIYLFKIKSLQNTLDRNTPPECVNYIRHFIKHIWCKNIK